MEIRYVEQWIANDLCYDLSILSLLLRSQSDDFDLTQIFADYFINEFEDPINAYTSSMANYGGAATSVAMGQQGVQQYPTPPTVGVRTAFHTGDIPMVKKPKYEPQPATIAAPSVGGLTSRLGLPIQALQANNGQLSGAPTVSGISLPVGVGIRLGGA